MSWGAFAGAAVSALGSMAGSAMANEANREMSEETRQWQEKMSNSAHQREVADLRAAGLNPILSAGGGGSSTPPPVTPQMVDEIGEGVRSGVSSAMQGMRLETELDMMKQQVKNIEADTSKKWEETGVASGTNLLVKQNIEAAETNNRILREQEEVMRAASAKAQAESELFESGPGTIIRKMGAILRELGITGDSAISTAQRARGAGGGRSR